MTSLRPVAYETLHWAPRLDGGHPRSARRGGPYQASIPPRIADLAVSMSPAAQAEAEEATAAIARFDAELGAEIAPFAAVLLRTESAASSRIENLTASARSIAEAELPGMAGKADAGQIVANTAAMQAAIVLSDNVDAQAILAMHAALMTDQTQHHPGRWRTEQVWIGGGNSPLTAVFVPPRHERVPELIDDLITFIARDDIALLPQIAVGHAQFETIHPFTDGNGRTGRALAQAMLRNKGLTRQVTVPVSAGLLAETDGYFAALGAYRTGDLTSIVEHFAQASLRAVANGRTLIAELRNVRHGWDELIRARRDSAVWRVADLLTRRPVVNAALLAQELGIESTNAHRYLNPLVEAGILMQSSGSRRNQVWRAPEVLDALDAFAERAGRRG